MPERPLSQDQIEALNAQSVEALHEDYDALARTIARRGADIDAIRRKVADFSVALPSWGSGR